MTFNRNVSLDHNATSAVLKEVLATGCAPTRRPDWLGHTRGGADVNALLTLGATMEQLAATGRATKSSVRAQMQHLRREHGLIIIRQGDVYRFLDPNDYEDFLEEDVPGGPEDSEPRENVQPVRSKDIPTEVGPTWPREKLSIATGQESLPASTSPPLEAAAQQGQTEPSFAPVAQPDPVASDLWTWGAVARDGTGTEILFDHDQIKKRCEEAPVSVTFMITGTNPDAVRSAVNSVATVLSREDETVPRLWRRSPPKSGFYNYRYQDLESRVFYVGKGKGGRAYDHVRDVFKKLRSVPPKPLIGEKERRISAQIPHAATTGAAAVSAVGSNIRIEQFSDDHWSELVSFVVEKLYISHVYKAYDVANDTCGNTRHEVVDREAGDSSLFRWVVQPRQASLDGPTSAKWCDISREFLDLGKLSLSSQAQMVWMDVEPLAATSPVVSALNGDRRLQWIGAGPLRSQDVVLQWNVVDTPFCIELICSRKAPTVRVNLRPRRSHWSALPLSDDRQAFAERIRDHGGLPIGVIRNADFADCFVKPFSPGSDGRRDPDFSLVDPTVKTAVQVDWMEAPIDRTLPEAIDTLLDALRPPANDESIDEIRTSS